MNWFKFIARAYKFPWNSEMEWNIFANTNRMNIFVFVMLRSCVHEDSFAFVCDLKKIRKLVRVRSWSLKKNFVRLRSFMTEFFCSRTFVFLKKFKNSFMFARDRHEHKRARTNTNKCVRCSALVKASFVCDSSKNKHRTLNALIVSVSFLCKTFNRLHLKYKGRLFRSSCYRARYALKGNSHLFVELYFCEWAQHNTVDSGCGGFFVPFIHWKSILE